MKVSIDVSSNVRILVTENGVSRVHHEGHNVFLDSGRDWLARLLGYDTSLYGIVDPPAAPPPAIFDLEPAAAAAPDFVRDVTGGAAPPPAILPTTAHVWMPWRPFYIGLGIGGNQQSGPIPTVLDTDYPGTNIQSDADRTVTGLERPVRVRWSWPNWARWLLPISVSFPAMTPYTWIKYTAVFDANDINSPAPIPPYPTVPVSEVAIYPWTNDPDGASLVYPSGLPFVTGQAIAYHLFPPIAKFAGATTITVEWSFILE